MDFPITRAENQFLCVLFKDHQEELDTPFTLDHDIDFFTVEGMQNGQKVEMIIPKDMECYFEIRHLDPIG